MAKLPGGVWGHADTVMITIFWGGGKLLPLKSLMSRNAGRDKNGDSGEISSVNLTIFMQITSTEMDLTCWRI